MAKRLATEIVKACLRLSENELLTLMRRMTERQIHPKVKVLDNGNQEIVLADELLGEDVMITFECKAGMYVMGGGFRTANLKLADLLRRTIIQCKGDAIVHRIYAGFTMAYHYARGAVVKIEELTEGGCRTVFAYKDTLGQMEHTFRRYDVENEIGRIRHEINMLLDQRFDSRDVRVRSHIDERLSALTHRLFVLEA